MEEGSPQAPRRFLHKFIAQAVTFLHTTALIQHSDAECAGSNTRASGAVCFCDAQQNTGVCKCEKQFALG
jgi:hypothetical protein